jgi:FKBP-type peptidyl-prolyl cis-trans isomerase 2
MVIENGKTVKVEYEGTLDDGTIFDTSKHDDHSHPIEFKIGTGVVIPGFENAIKSLKLNEEKIIRLEPKEAYGEINPDLIKAFPKEQMPKPDEGELEAGMILGMQLPNGQQLPVKIAEVTDDKVKVDLNHPLAGKALNFKVKVIEIN